MDRQRKAAGLRSPAAVEAEIARLEALPLDALRKEWTKVTGKDVSRLRSRSVLLRALAWQVQAEAFGGLDVGSERRIRAIATGLENGRDYVPKTRRNLSAGVVLTREWKGVVHTVIVTPDGFQHLGRRYNSLSDVARSITGTKWSGPRFFGLEQKPASRSGEPAS